MFNIAGRDLAVDLGTSNTLVYMRGHGIVLNEPSVVALRQHGKRRTPIAFGAEAKSILGKEPEGVVVVKPVKAGVISDFESAGVMLNHFLKTALRYRPFFKPRVVVSVPNTVTEVEKRAIRDSVDGGATVKLIDQAMAAAIGSNLPIMEPTASLIVDIGGGAIDVAVISMGQIVCCQSVRQGGEAMDEAIINYMRRHHQFIIGENTAEMIKKTIGAATNDFDAELLEVKGRSVTKGTPSTTVVSGAEIRHALAESVAGVVSAIRSTLEQTPPELAGDVMSIGLTLVGGGALLRGIDKYISKELQVAVKLADDPLGAVAFGAGKCMEREFGIV